MRATTAMFSTMLRLKKANPALSKRLVQLFEINFETIKKVKNPAQIVPELQIEALRR